MEFDKKLEQFSNIVLREASEEKQRVLAEVKTKINEANKKTKEDIIKKAEYNLKLEIEKTIREKNETVSKKAIESRRIVIEKRKELLDKIYSSVTERLIEFTECSEYSNWIIEKIEKAKLDLNDINVVVYISESDKKLLNTILEKTKVKLKLDESIKLGGCKIVSETQNMLVDNTLKNMLDEAFNNFNMLVIKS